MLVFLKSFFVKNKIDGRRRLTPYLWTPSCYWPENFFTPKKVFHKLASINGIKFLLVLLCEYAWTVTSLSFGFDGEFTSKNKTLFLELSRVADTHSRKYILHCGYLRNIIAMSTDIVNVYWRCDFGNISMIYFQNSVMFLSVNPR